MINDIIKGVAKAIRNEFGEDSRIYTEEIKQGLKEPCFFISALNPQMKQVLGKRYLISCQVMVQYITEEGKAECNDIAMRLFELLELITVSGDLVRGKNMSYEVSDGILSFNVSYDIFVYKTEETKDYIETIEQRTEVQNG
jgi:hypothetical protein